MYLVGLGLSGINFGGSHQVGLILIKVVMVLLMTTLFPFPRVEEGVVVQFFLSMMEKDTMMKDYSIFMIPMVLTRLQLIP
ncbi:hypothetical protein ES703_103904 [subsurface metagenome]